MTTDPPTVSLAPTVVAERELSLDGTTLEPVMKCEFSEPAAPSVLRYNIQWSINNINLANASFSLIEYGNLGKNAALRPDHWTRTYRLNMNVRNHQNSVINILQSLVNFLEHLFVHVVPT